MKFEMKKKWCLKWKKNEVWRNKKWKKNEKKNDNENDNENENEVTNENPNEKKWKK